MHSRQAFECSITSSGEKGAWGGEIAPTIGMATAMIDTIVEEFDARRILHPSESSWRITRKARSTKGESTVTCELPKLGEAQ